MNDQPSTAAPPAAPPPTALILSYLTPSGALTPTRVRRIASWLVAALGIALLLLSVWPWYFIVLEIVDTLRYGVPLLFAWRYYFGDRLIIYLLAGIPAAISGI